ncbi:hypothetical protein GE061_001844 [Apolygus lucorum]|uniref:BTB domain-containing protein n=1 Tax=Apolygus lucorum TaxID=248454 RepID=A0A6A4JEE6_APOLU|nr:hypothetical protein GE061_001844 [Apolygus lucorum]
MSTMKCALDGVTARQRVFPALYQFYVKGELVDATVEVRGVHIRIHRIVLALHSPVFRAMFQSGMKETCSNHIVIDDVEPDTFHQVVHYLYTGLCPDLKTHLVDIFRFAVKYDLSELVDMCEKMSAECRNVDNALEYLVLADMLCKDAMKSGVLDFIKPRIHSIVKMDLWNDLSFQLKTKIAMRCPTTSISPMAWVSPNVSVLRILSETTVNWYVNSSPFISGNPITSERFQLRIKGKVVSFCFTFCRYKKSPSVIQMVLLSADEVPLSICGKFVLHGVRTPFSSVTETISWTKADVETPSYVVPGRKNVMSLDLKKSDLRSAEFLSKGTVVFSFALLDSSKICLMNHQTVQQPALRPYLNSGQFSDVIFLVDDKTFYGHRVILASLCPAFQKIFNTAGTDYRLNGVTAHNFHTVLRYVYNNELPDPSTVSESTLEAAWICQLDMLFNHCEDALLERVRLDSAIINLVAGHRLSALRLKDRAKLFIKSNLSAVTNLKSWNQLENHPDLFNELLYDLASICPLIPDVLDPPQVANPPPNHLPP